MIEEAEAEIKAGKLMREQKIDSYLPEFREMLENKKLAPLTVRGRMTGVSSFYKSNGIPLPLLPRSTMKAKPELKRRAIPSKEDLQHILKFCDPLEEAIILVGVSSGLSVSDIINLKARDFYTGYDAETGITQIHLRRQKTDVEFTTFFTPEASKAVWDYLNYRAREGKVEDEGRKKQLEKQRLLFDKSGKPLDYCYLFITRTVLDTYLNANIKPIDREKIRQLSEKTVMSMYRQVCEEANASAPKGEWNVIRSHNLRRYFNSALLNAGAQLYMVDYMVGHQLDATHDAYYRNNPASLKVDYKKYIPYLTINKETDEELMQKYEEEVKKTKALETDVIKMAVERSELQDVKEQLENERANRVELEKNIDVIIQEKMNQAIRELDESMKRLKSNMKQTPIEGL
ncbi:MAG TPA: tyrosine-type recombinase/integrase [Methanosarcina sp.]|nr:tyrosine-type recombinase/integrase [Methanosarcina sp.]